jgi:hypothetical protein
LPRRPPTSANTAHRHEPDQDPLLATTPPPRGRERSARRRGHHEDRVQRPCSPARPSRGRDGAQQRAVGRRGRLDDRHAAQPVSRTSRPRRRPACPAP